MKEIYKLSRFSKSDYKEYKSWFANPWVKKSLEKIDEEWLNYVLTDKGGEELVAHDSSSQLVAVIGIVLPSQTDNYYVLTNFAINPKLFRKRIGSQILNQVIERYKLDVGQKWIAFVSRSNEGAQRFFEKNNWIKMGDTINDTMIKYRLK